jgi:hypothetical protein
VWCAVSPPCAVSLPCCMNHTRAKRRALAHSCNTTHNLPLMIFNDADMPPAPCLAAVHAPDTASRAGYGSRAAGTENRGRLQLVDCLQGQHLPIQGSCTVQDLWLPHGRVVLISTACCCSLLCCSAGWWCWFRWGPPSLSRCLRGRLACRGGIC